MHTQRKSSPTVHLKLVGILSVGILSGWDFVRLGFCPLGFCPLGFCPLGFCPALPYTIPDCRWEAKLPDFPS